MLDVPVSHSGAGLGEANRRRLAALNRALPGPFDANDAAKVLGIDRSEAAKAIGYLASKGWLSRVRRGLFTVVPLEADAPMHWRADPWLVAARIFDPCYIGGWSACEHWSLTEQLFRSVVVVTAHPQRSSRSTVQGTDFVTAVRGSDLLFGTNSVWRERTRVAVSDPSRTIIDILDDPAIGGGIRHVSDVLAEYVESPHRDDDLLISYGDRLGNRTAFKRLGLLLEAMDFEVPEMLDACLARRSAGVSKLDPTITAGGRISSRWGLRVNASISRGDPS